MKQIDYIRPNVVTDAANNDDDDDVLYKDKVVEENGLAADKRIEGFHRKHQLICKVIEAVNGNAGSHGVHGGIDGFLTSHFIEIVITIIREFNIGVGVDFGSGTGITATIIAEFTNMKMICIEVIIILTNL